MLYVTTRNNADVYTVQHPLSHNRGEDGGLFVPFHDPVFSPQEIADLGTRTFCQNVALMLNCIFGTKLTAWDLEFTVGRNPVRIQPLRHRILMGELWRNPEWNFDRILRLLRQKLGAEERAYYASWTEMGIRICVLFAVYGELLRMGTLEAGEKIDVAAVAGDLSAPVSAWYARNWGLPIENIIFCCNENSELWNLICHGQFRTDTVSVSTETPEADITLPENLERLIYGCGGREEVDRFLQCCRRGGMYIPTDRALTKLREGVFVSVISGQRMQQSIPGVYTTHGYLLSPYTALAYAGLLDYRAKSGQLRHGLVLAEKSPVCDIDTVCRALEIAPDQLKKLL